MPAPCIVTVPPDTHIPVHVGEIRLALADKVEAGKLEQFEQVADLVENLCSYQFGTFRRTMKTSLHAFTGAAQGMPMQARLGSAPPKDAELYQQEGQVLQDLLALMAAARFHLLTDDEWQTAMLEDFMFSLPVEVNFNVFDTKMLTAFWSGSEDRKRLRRLLPEMSDCILVFHRGVAVAEAEGMYITEKLNLLVDRLILQPLGQAGRVIMYRVASLRGLKPEEAKPPPPPASVVPAPAPGEAPHRNQKTVERRTLARTLPTCTDVIKNMFTKIHLQEPMFKKMVILYRTVAPEKAAAKAAAGGLADAKLVSKDQQLKDALEKHNIHIRSFHNVPMADAEIIFPEKRVYINPVSLVQLVATMVMAVITALVTIWQGRGSVDLRLIFGALSVVMARCVQVHTSLQGERSSIQQRMVQTQYNAADDSHEGVVGTLIEDMADQQVKEMIIAYALLVRRLTFTSSITGTSGMSAEQLDRECEDWLEATFGLKADFSVENALSRLFEWGLVKHHPGSYVGGDPALSSYVAVPLSEATKILTEYWTIVPSQPAAVMNQVRSLPVTDLLVKGGHLPLNTTTYVGQSRSLLSELRPSKARQYSISRRRDSATASIVGNLLDAVSFASPTSSTDRRASQMTGGPSITPSMGGLGDGADDGGGDSVMVDKKRTPPNLLLVKAKSGLKNMFSPKSRKD